MSVDEVINIADDWRARGKPDYIDGIFRKRRRMRKVQKKGYQAVEN